MSNHKPELCEDCPRKSLLPLIRNVSWTNSPTLNSTVKLCAKLRAYKYTNLPKCPYFAEEETLIRFLKKKKR